ncbi:MAG: hypothetical protein AB7X49_00355 [Geminicoccaceae bacterium]
MTIFSRLKRFSLADIVAGGIAMSMLIVLGATALHLVPAADPVVEMVEASSS